KELEAGYAAAPRPLFLLNIGHAYRRAQELAKAKEAYEKLLALQPDLPQRAEVEGYVKSIDDALQLAEPSPADGAAGRSPPRPAVMPPTASGPAPLLLDPGAGATPAAALPPVPAAAVAQTSAEGPRGESGSVVRRPWFWVIVGAVVAGGVAAAIIAARP